MIYPRLLIGCGMLVCFTNLSLMGFWVRYLALFNLFSGINSLEWLWMGSLHKNIQLMLESLKAPFLALHFSYYMLINFLMIDITIYADDTSDIFIDFMGILLLAK